MKSKEKDTLRSETQEQRTSAHILSSTAPGD